jgi:hypothetical protein
MLRKIVALGVVSSFLIFALPGFSCGDTAEVLPKGRSRISVGENIWLPVKKRYDPDGHIERVAVDFNTTLDQVVFPELAALDPLVSDGANVGRTIVRFRYILRDTDIAISHGITDRLSAGIFIPIWYQKNEVKAHVDTSQANVGRNPYYDQGILPPELDAAPLIPIAMGGVPLTDNDVKDMLSQGLDANRDGTIDIPGYGYERFESWRGHRISDIEFGLKFKYLETKNWRLAAGFGARFATGEIDDPDHLVDLGFGDGQHDLLFRLYSDYTGIKNLVINGTFRYDLQLPDEEVRRISPDVNIPIAINEEKVERNLGDIFGFEFEGKYTFLEVFTFWVLYDYSFKRKDSIDGDKGYAYESLEDETDWTSHIAKAGLSFSTTPWYLQKKFPLPLDVSFVYRNRFEGSNNAWRGQYFTMQLTAYF